MLVKTLSPKVEILNKIGEQSCASLYNMAKYATYTASDNIKFGDSFYTVAQFCEKWAAHRASLFIVYCWTGAPGKASFRKMPLHRLGQDWYLAAVARGNEYVVNKVEDNFA